jgi:hypothetical protein
LAASDIPSVLLLTAEQPTVSSKSDTLAEPLRNAYLELHFGDTLQVLERATNIGFLRSAHRAPPAHAEPVAMFAAISTSVRCEQDASMADRLADAFALDRAKYQASFRQPSRCDLIIRRLRESPTPVLSLEDAEIRLTEGVELVVRKWNWRAWLESGSQHLDEAVSFDASTFIVWNDVDGVRTRELSPLALLVLEHIAGFERTTSAAALDVVVRALGESDSVSRIRPLVTDQLMALYRAGLIELYPPVVQPAEP